MSGDVADIKGLPVVTQPVENRLAERELVDYRDYNCYSTLLYDKKWGAIPLSDTGNSTWQEFRL